VEPDRWIPDGPPKDAWALAHFSMRAGMFVSNGEAWFRTEGGPAPEFRREKRPGTGGDFPTRDGGQADEPTLRHPRGVSRQDKPNHGAKRLATAIEATLSQVLPLAGDPQLLHFGIAAVLPLSHGKRFVVQVHSLDPDLTYDPEAILEALQRVKPFLRREVAQDVQRKHAPDFRFQVFPPGARID